MSDATVVLLGVHKLRRRRTSLRNDLGQIEATE
jgi:hypothetical protein